MSKIMKRFFLLWIKRAFAKVLTALTFLKTRTLKVFAFLGVLCLFAGLSFYFVSCSQSLSLFGQKDYSAFASLPDWDADSATIPNDRFFYVRIKPGSTGGRRSLRSLFYELEGGVGTDCKIPIDQESSEDVFCMLEKTEADLWAHSTPLEYNVPPGMCHYLSFRVHWHWNQNAGRGPEIVYKCEKTTGTGDNQETEDVYCPPSSRGGTPCGDNNQAPRAAGCKEKIEDLCEYDLSQEDEDLKNCCIGTYEVQGEDGEDGNWGDDLSECIGGLGRVNWSEKTDDGIPVTKIESAEKDGVIGTYEIPSIDQFFDGAPKKSIGGVAPYSNRYVDGFSFTVANYYEDLEENSSTNQPEFYTTEPLHGGSSSPTAGYPYITWACLDDHFEVMHQIHLMIREWNSREEFTRFIESGGSRGDPDVTGTEGSDCDYYDAGVNSDLAISQCNDLPDADDWRENVSGHAFPGVIYQ